LPFKCNLQRYTTGYIKIQQQEYSSSDAAYVSSDRIVVDAGGAITVTTHSGEHLTLASQGGVPSIVSLNAKAAAISKQVTMTNSAASPVTVATVRLQPVGLYQLNPISLNPKP
jgi:hypothetical protein